MPKPVITVDLNGALLQSRPFDIAHKEWFRIMGELIKDYSINEHAFEADYYSQVQDIMKKYIGDVDVRTRNAFARNIYAMSVVESIKKWDLVEDFAAYLRELKKKYSIILITTAPTMAVHGILEKVGCEDLFDMIVASPMEDTPHKKELTEHFIKRHGKPLFYIGQGDGFIEIAKGLGLKTIVVDWVAAPESKGNFEAHTVDELRKIIERFTI